jgi:hypothetical protein
LRPNDFLDSFIPAPLGSNSLSLGRKVLGSLDALLPTPVLVILSLLDGDILNTITEKR